MCSRGMSKQCCPVSFRQSGRPSPTVCYSPFGVNLFGAAPFNLFSVCVFMCRFPILRFRARSMFIGSGKGEDESKVGVE